VAESKQDRELIELLNELRVALPGVQVLFAFLLAVPFQQGFAKVTDTQKGALFIALLCTAIATIFLIAPSSFHRIQWRAHDKEKLLVISNGLTIVGLIFLASAVTAAVFLVTDYLFGGPTSTWVTAGIGLLFAVLWYVIPLYRRAKTPG
jgi:membrane protein YdbS with pleckstrin-like domain